jgi:hypothetical protein
MSDRRITEAQLAVGRKLLAHLSAATLAAWIVGIAFWNLRVVLVAAVLTVATFVVAMGMAELERKNR